MFATFKDMGKTIAAGWGHNNENINDIDELIKRADSTKMLVCLMARLVDQMGTLQATLQHLVDATRDRATSKSAEDIEFIKLPGKMLIPIPKLCIGLSVRSRKILRNSGFRYLSELEDMAILQLRNCGATATAEILQWRETIENIVLHHLDNLEIPTDPESKPWQELSTRARKLISSGQFTLLSQLTPENLEKARRCGPRTTKELLEWAAKLRGKAMMDLVETL